MRVHPLFLMIPFVLPIALAMDMYLPCLPSMTKSLDVEPHYIQLTLTIYLYCYALGQLIIGPVSDILGRRKVLLACLALFTVGSIVCASTSSFALVMVGRILQALGACGSSVVTMAIINDKFDTKEATFMFTALRGAGGISPILAPSIGAFLQSHYGWQANFFAMSAYGAAILMLAFVKIKETKKKTTQTPSLWSPFKSYKKIICDKQFLYFAACAMAAQSAMFGYFSLSSRYYVTEFGLSESEFAMLFSCNSLVYLLTGIFGGKIINQLGFKRSTQVAAGLFVLSACGMVFGHYFYDHHFALFIPNLLASSGVALMLGASASGALIPFKAEAGTAAALLSCMEFLGGGFIGSLAIMGENATALPLAGCLIMVGLTILSMNMFFGKKMLPSQ